MEVFTCVTFQGEQRLLRDLKSIMDAHKLQVA
jgi:hypothetical protein